MSRPIVSGRAPIVAALVAVALAVLPGPAWAQRVRQVFDGDTISVANVGVVRLIGVDAPEKQGSYRASEPFGDAAAAQRWLAAPAMGLDGARPIDLLRTLQGSELVAEFLGRLEHGVYN